MYTRLISVIGLLALFFPSPGQETDSLKYISLRPAEFKTALQNDGKAVLIDVREIYEYRKSRIEHSVNIPSSGNLSIADTLKRDCPLFLYCSSGFRSRVVARQFASMGFSRVYSLEGGINEWKKEGFPVNRKRIRK